MKSNNTNKKLIDFIKKFYLLGIFLFSYSYITAQDVTPENQLKMLKMNFSALTSKHDDSLTKLPSTVEYNHKIFLNDTIKKPFDIKEATTFQIEKKVILETNPKNTFLFQIKKKIVEKNEDGLIEYYYCMRGNKLYLITLTKDGVYIRKNKSYYSSFFYKEEI